MSDEPCLCETPFTCLAIHAAPTVGPCEHDTLGCGWREPHEGHSKVGDGRPCCGWPPRCA